MPRLQVETRHARPGQSNRLDGARSDAMTAESVVESIKKYNIVSPLHESTAGRQQFKAGVSVDIIIEAKAREHGSSQTLLQQISATQPNHGPGDPSVQTTGHSAAPTDGQLIQLQSAPHLV